MSLWHLYINDELILDVPVYRLFDRSDSTKKDINYYADMPFEGSIESAWLIPVSVTGDEIPDDKIVFLPLPAEGPAQ